MRLDLLLPIDPRLLQVNRRIRGGHWVPTDVRKAMQDVTDACSLHFTDEWRELPSSTTFGMELRFWFPTLRSDIDGPVKRTIDAVFRALRDCTQRPYANDTRVTQLHCVKSKGEPRLFISLSSLDTDSGTCYSVDLDETVDRLNIEKCIRT